MQVGLIDIPKAHVWVFNSGELTSICSGKRTLTKLLLFNTWCILLSWKVLHGVIFLILGNFLPIDNDLFTPPFVNLYTRNILLGNYLLTNSIDLPTPQVKL